MIADSCRYLKSLGKEVIFDGEHFFDGFNDDPDYAMAALNDIRYQRLVVELLIKNEDILF